MPKAVKKYLEKCLYASARSVQVLLFERFQRDVAEFVRKDGGDVEVWKEGERYEFQLKIGKYIRFFGTPELKKTFFQCAE